MLRFHTKCTFYPLGGRGGGTQQIFTRGGSAPGSTPYPFAILHEKSTPFVYLLLTNGTPSTYLVYNFVFLLTAVNELSFKKESITQIERFLD